jgi:hypothetical protein
MVYSCGYGLMMYSCADGLIVLVVQLLALHQLKQRDKVSCKAHTNADITIYAFRLCLISSFIHRAVNVDTKTLNY